eukprot:1324778-Amorphochlora_amoeboformis.AAC.1
MEMPGILPKYSAVEPTLTLNLTQNLTLTLTLTINLRSSLLHAAASSMGWVLGNPLSVAWRDVTHCLNPVITGYYRVLPDDDLQAISSSPSISSGLQMSYGDVSVRSAGVYASSCVYRCYPY